VNGDRLDRGQDAGPESGDGVADEGTSGAAGPVSEADVRQLAAERDALQAELERIRGPRRRRIRRVVVAILVALTSLLIVLSTVVVWSHRTLLNTDTFVGTVSPVLQEPGVDSAIATRSTNQLFAALDVQREIRQALPPRIGFAAAPITDAARGAVTNQLTKVVGSSRFQQLWTHVLTQTHQQLVAVLRGQHSDLVTTSNGYIVLNTLPVINNALGEISGTVSSLTGRNVSLPTITSAELPSQAVDKLSKALGVKLPSDYGQVTLVRAKNLSVAQHGVRAFDRLAILLPILTAALIALTLWLSVSRRRTLVQLVTVTALLTIVVRRVLIYEQGSLSTSAKNPEVAHNVLGQLLAGFYDGTAWVLWAAFIILIVALLTGPYPWAVALRGWVRRGWEWVAQALDAEHRARAARWTAARAAVLQLSAAVVAFILLLIVSVSWISFLIIGVLLAVSELYLNAVKQQPPEDVTPEQDLGPPPVSPTPSSQTPV
jgi:hypothetical protein